MHTHQLTYSDHKIYLISKPNLVPTENHQSGFQHIPEAILHKKYDRRIFITGGTGFFGRSLLRYLIETNCDQIDRFKLTLLTRSPQSFLNLYPEFKDIKWINFHEGNILDPQSFPKSQSFTHILHAAADSTYGSQLSPLDRYNQILDGTRNLLDYAVQHQIPRFLLTSSGAVYGSQPIVWLRYRRTTVACQTP